MDELLATYFWLPPAAQQALIAAWEENPNDPWSIVRQDPRYEQWFPGNLTDDGRPRYDESVYASVIEDYDEVFRSVGLNPQLFRERYPGLIRGDVSPDELWQERVEPVYERVVAASPSIQAYYTAQTGLELTPEAILAGVLDPDLGSRILNQEIAIAEIGGEALESGFELDRDLAEKLWRTGELSRAEADRLFETAQAALPTLNVLARRHADPDDDFDIHEFVAADVWRDPFQRRRMRRLVSQEQAMWGTALVPALGLGQFRVGQSGGLSGLERI